MKVIIMTSWRTEGLQKRVNTFLEGKKEVIDIKYTAMHSDELDKDEYSAMIIYK